MTVDELKADLQKATRGPNLVYFGDGLPTRSDMWAIQKVHGFWQVYYFERGNRVAERWFTDEETACEHLCRQLREDGLAGLSSL